MNETMLLRVGTRIRARREQMGFRQEELAHLMALPHRQTLGSIELGERRTKPAELAAAARALEVPLDYFTDPFQAGGEAAFSFRAEAADDAALEWFEEQGGRWLATYDQLAQPSLLRQSLGLTIRDSYEKAQEAGDATRRQLGLRQFPARDLGEALEREWGVLVLYVDTPEGVSGAASRLHGVQAILLNRNEPLGRRNYNLAHEAFHLLTWDTMPPARLDTERPIKDANRIEQMANNFAAGLLMPAESIRESWRELGDGELAERIHAMASLFHVSASAMKWRILNLELVKRNSLPSDVELAAKVGQFAGERSAPPQFNAKFVGLVYSAVEAGRLSLRKAAAIFGTSSHGFAEICRSYGRVLSYET